MRVLAARNQVNEVWSRCRYLFPLNLKIINDAPCSHYSSPDPDSLPPKVPSSNSLLDWLPERLRLPLPLPLLLRLSLRLRL